jgi:hypothetical protein
MEPQSAHADSPPAAYSRILPPIMTAAILGACFPVFLDSSSIPLDSFPALSAPYFFVPPGFLLDSSPALSLLPFRSSFNQIRPSCQCGVCRFGNPASCSIPSVCVMYSCRSSAPYFFVPPGFLLDSSPALSLLPFVLPFNYGCCHLGCLLPRARSRAPVGESWSASGLLAC